MEMNEWDAGSSKEINFYNEVKKIVSSLLIFFSWSLLFGKIFFYVDFMKEKVNLKVLAWKRWWWRLVSCVMTTSMMLLFLLLANDNDDEDRCVSFFATLFPWLSQLRGKNVVCVCWPSVRVCKYLVNVWSAEEKRQRATLLFFPWETRMDQKKRDSVCGSEPAS